MGGELRNGGLQCLDICNTNVDVVAFFSHKCIQIFAVDECTFMIDVTCLLDPFV